jgi:hypothetical protein
LKLVYIHFIASTIVVKGSGARSMLFMVLGLGSALDALGVAKKSAFLEKTQSTSKLSA